MKGLIVYGYQNMDSRLVVNAQRAFTQQFRNRTIDWTRLDQGNVFSQDVQIAQELGDAALLLIPVVKHLEERVNKEKGVLYYPKEDTLFNLFVQMQGSFDCLISGSFSDIVPALRDKIVFELYMQANQPSIYAMAQHARRIHDWLQF
jgi:hypothetical protein